MLTFLLWVLTGCIAALMVGGTMALVCIGWDYATARMLAKVDTMGVLDDVQRRALQSAADEGERLRREVNRMLAE